MLEIRPLTPDDYPALVDIRDACWPTQKRTLEELRSEYARRRQDLVLLHFLALEDGVSVGVASASQAERKLKSGTYWSNLMVHPQARRRGVGEALYTHLIRELEPHPFRTLVGYTQEGQTDAVKFLEARNWKEHNRSWESWLELDSFDQSRFAGAVERTLEQGYRITTFDVLERKDPEARRKLYDLDCDAGKNIPGEDNEFTQLTFERYWEQISQNPNYRP